MVLPVTFTVEIVNVNFVLRGVEAELTGGAGDDSLRSLATEQEPTDGDQTEQPQPTPKRHDARAVSTPLWARMLLRRLPWFRGFFFCYKWAGLTGRGSHLVWRGRTVSFECEIIANFGGNTLARCHHGIHFL